MVCVRHDKDEIMTTRRPTDTEINTQILFVLIRGGEGEAMGSGKKGKGRQGRAS